MKLLDVILVVIAAAGCKKGLTTNKEPSAINSSSSLRVPAATGYQLNSFTLKKTDKF